jgi:hypothetical protein
MTKKSISGYYSNWSKVKSISIGLVITGFIIWIIFHTGQYVPEGSEDHWQTVLIMYGLMSAMIFGNSDIRNKLYNVELLRFFPRFILFFLVGVTGFFILLQYYDEFGNSLLNVLNTVPVWLALIHAFVFAAVESAIWQGYLDGKIGHPASELVAGFFHWGVWSGGAISVIISAGLLFTVFSLANYFFADNKNDLAPAIGIHAAWNVVKLGLLFGGV